ncbi:MAG: dUTP diphosphatase [Candidatus Kapabacteria bacterium]|nr:dUTP diphosphatase [Ignavibacteriota bacterium]MCW5886098.1 dUTP diphosphatase [Candidatus Kapabacteria bacterium]
MSVSVKITRLDSKFDDLPLPSYMTEGSAGMDVYAAIENDIEIKSGGTVLVPTSLAIELPTGFECQVRSRSGLALKSGIFALNAPGTIDSDYRGEIGVILSNFSQNDFTIKRGDRIAQLVVARYERVEWVKVDSLSDTERSSGGFGSSGVRK